MSWVENHPWYMYLISGLIVMVGSFIIHSKFNNGINIETLLLVWLIGWVLLLIPITIAEMHEKYKGGGK